MGADDNVKLAARIEIRVQRETELARDTYGITIPWSPWYIFTVRGSENFHILLWIGKDLSWTQKEYYCALTFGSLAVAWCGILAYHAFTPINWVEIYQLVAVFLWLLGNFVWMYGEIQSPSDDAIHQPMCAHILEAAIGWLLLYHLVLRPLRVIAPDDNLRSKYAVHGLTPPISYFRTWREYEHIHTLFWLCKDCSWANYQPISWIVFLIPTYLISVDFVLTTFLSGRMTVECAYYIAIMMWVTGNALWAIGEIFMSLDDDGLGPIYLFQVSIASQENMRYWASWALFSAYFPIILLHAVWIPLTWYGRLDCFVEAKEEEDEEIGELESNPVTDDQEKNQHQSKNLAHTPFPLTANGEDTPLISSKNGNK